MTIVEDRYGLDSFVVPDTTTALAFVVCYDCATPDVTVWTQANDGSISFEDLFLILREHDKEHDAE